MELLKNVLRIRKSIKSLLIEIFRKMPTPYLPLQFAAKIGTHSNLDPMNTLVTLKIGFHDQVLKGPKPRTLGLPKLMQIQLFSHSCFYWRVLIFRW